MTNSVVCPVCDSEDLAVRIEHRDKVPTLQNTTLPTPQEARSFPCGQLDIYQCAVCEFVWNNAFNPGIISYDDDYNNDVSSSAFYLNHLDEMADRVLEFVPIKDQVHYTEIGCGQADFLKLIVQRSNNRCKSAIGFDPSFHSEGSLPECAEIHKSYFSKDDLGLIPKETNIVCSRHTIEHVPDVQHFISALAAVMTEPDRHLFLETPDVDWILANHAAQDFFYEHCSLFNRKSITTLLARYGLNADVSYVYNGQYLWVSATKTAAPVFNKIPTRLLGSAYSEHRDQLIASWSNLTDSLNESGPVAIWGAASKGVTFALIVENDGNPNVSCAIDLNTEKQGRHLPLTGLPVLSPSAAKESGIKSIIIMNPNYESEIRNMVSELNWQPRIAVLRQ